MLSEKGGHHWAHVIGKTFLQVGRYLPRSFQKFLKIMKKTNYLPTCIPIR